MVFFWGLNALSHGVVYQDISLERNSGNESWISRPILGVEQCFAHKLHNKMQLPQSNCRVPLHGHDWSHGSGDVYSLHQNHHVNLMYPSQCLFLNAFLKTSLVNEPMKWVKSRCTWLRMQQNATGPLRTLRRRVLGKRLPKLSQPLRHTSY